MLVQKLISRNTSFSQCQDCLALTLQQQPIAKMLMKPDQILCGACANTSIHIVPMDEQNLDYEEQAMIIYEKIYCKKHLMFRQCKLCSSYLNRANYSECPFCRFSIFRRNMRKWKVLFPIYKCEMCQKPRCLICQMSPETLSAENTEELQVCSNCKQLEVNKKRQFKESLKMLPTFHGVQFMFAVVCVVLFTPFQLFCIVTEKVNKALCRPIYKVYPLKYSFYIILTIILYPIIWIIWFLIRFIPYYWECLKTNIDTIHYHIIRKNMRYNK